MADGANFDTSLHQIVQAIVTVLAVINPVEPGGVRFDLPHADANLKSRQKWQAAVYVALSILRACSYRCVPALLWRRRDQGADRPRSPPWSRERLLLANPALPQTWPRPLFGGAIFFVRAGDRRQRG